jgi:D-tyrosyl-tRNA(Tyr) deacylase
MKAVVQRARNASVAVNGVKTGGIDRGLLVYLGVAEGDSEKDADRLAEKIANLRIFEDALEKMNLSLRDIVNGKEEGLTGVLAVSQFTLLADARKGRRPYYGNAAEPARAKALYEYFMEKIREQGLVCEAGVFQARMDVSYTNDGPVTIILDSGELNGK